MEAYTVERESESTKVPSTVDISINDLTSNVQINDDGNLTGDGSFDKLMETVEKHISKQVDDGKITTEAYAEVYLNSLVKVLDVANTFTLESKVKNYQIQEIAENTKLTSSKKLLTDKQSELEIANTVLANSKSLLIVKQIDRESASIDLIKTQTQEIRDYKSKEYKARILFTDSQTELNQRRLASMDIEDALKTKQADTEESKKVLIYAQTGSELAKRDNTRSHTDLLKAQKSVESRRAALVNSQVNTEDQKTELTKAEIDSIVNYKNNNIHSNTLYNYAKITSADYQNALLTKQTEVAEEQKNLIERQTKGFDDDAKLRLLKEVLGNWSVAYSVSQDDVIPDSVKSNPIDSVTKNLFDSLGVTNQNDPLGED